MPTFQANPTRGATLLWSPWISVSTSQRTPRLSVTPRATSQSSCAKSAPIVSLKFKPGVAEALRVLEGKVAGLVGVEGERRARRERVGPGEVVEEGDEPPRLDDVAAELPLVRARANREVVDELQPLLDEVLRQRRSAARRCRRRPG